MPKNWQNSLLIIADIGLALYSILIIRKIKPAHIRLIFLIAAFMLMLIVSGIYSPFEYGLKSAILSSSILAIGIFMSMQSNWIENCLRCLLFFSIIHSVCTLFLFVFPDLFKIIVFPVLPNEISVEITWFMVHDLYSGITDQIARNAFYITVGIAIIAGNFISKYKKYSIFSILLICMLILTLLLTGKRSHTLSNIIAFIFMVGAFAKMQRKKVVTKILFSITGITLLSLVIILIVPMVGTPFVRLITSYNEGNIIGDRSELYAFAVQLFTQKPIFGWGVGAFSLFQNIGTHNVYLQMLCENGIVGAILFILILISNLLVTLKVIKIYSNLNNSLYDRYLCFSIYMQIFYILYCMSGNPFNDGFILIVYMIAMSIPYAMSGNFLKPHRRKIIHDIREPNDKHGV